MSEEPPVLPSAEPSPPEGAPKTSAAAIWSLVFGGSSFCLWIVGTALACLFGILSIVKINASQGRLRGRGLAITGMVLGGMGFFVLPVVAAMVLPAYMKVVERARIVKQEDDIRILHMACKDYAADHDGKFPPDLQDVYPDYLVEAPTLKAMSSETGQPEFYHYLPGFTDTPQFRTRPLIASPAPIGGQRVMALVGGEIVQVPEAEFQRLMAAHREMNEGNH